MTKMPCHIVAHTEDVPFGFVCLKDVEQHLGYKEEVRLRNLMASYEIETCRVSVELYPGRNALCYVNPNNIFRSEELPRQWLRERLVSVITKRLDLTPTQKRQQEIRLNNLIGAKALVEQLAAEQRAVKESALAAEQLAIKEAALAIAVASASATAPAALVASVEKSPSFAERLLAALESSTATQVQMIVALNRLEKIWAD